MLGNIPIVYEYSDISSDNILYRKILTYGILSFYVYIKDECSYVNLFVTSTDSLDIKPNIRQSSLAEAFSYISNTTLSM